MSNDAYADPDRLYFLFDFISHNAYLAWQPAQELAVRHGLRFEIGRAHV
jgi:2-hydroxychromene-2-carboxylate isomerase